MMFYAVCKPFIEEHTCFPSNPFGSCISVDMSLFYLISPLNSRQGDITTAVIPFQTSDTYFHRRTARGAAGPLRGIRS